MYDVICYGTVCQDRIIRIPRYPSCGSNVWIQEDRLAVGGEAGNSCRALSGWGMKTFLLGTLLGEDERAGWLLQRLRDLPGVDVRLEQSAQTQTPYCVILATPDGERTMLGCHFDLMRGQTVDILPPARVFTTEPYCRENAVHAARLARQMGLQVITMDTTETPELADLSDLIVTSTQEIARLLPPERQEAAGREAAVRLGRTVVLTNGAQGSVAFAPDGEVLHRQSAVPVRKVLDATGCGDVYRAGLVCGCAKGWSLAESMAFASAAASLNLMGMGGGGHVRSLDETLEVARRGSVD